MAGKGVLKIIPLYAVSQNGQLVIGFNKGGKQRTEDIGLAFYWEIYLSCFARFLAKKGGFLAKYDAEKPAFKHFKYQKLFDL